MIDLNDKDIRAFIKAMREHSCYDFSNYSINSLKRRVAKILTDSSLTIEQLIIEIGKDKAFTEKIVKNITVCTTELFRDPVIWQSLRDEMLNTCKNKPGINIWHAGCSTGQEVYSMMILLNEINFLDKAGIYATDINQDVLKVAAGGNYKYRFNTNYLENFDKVLNYSTLNYTVKNKVQYNKYFNIDIVKDNIQMKSFLTDKPVYKKMDLVREENPFHVIFDVIICRNVIIYFNYELQNKIFNLFFRNLTDNGCMILGSHESIVGPYSNFFEKKHQGYYKKALK